MILKGQNKMKENTFLEFAFVF